MLNWDGLGEKREEIKDFLKFNENDHETYLNLWDTMKTVLRGKFIALNAIKKAGKTPNQWINRPLENSITKEPNSPRRIRWQEIINFRAEINKIETIKSMWQRVGSLRKIKEIDKP